MTVRLGLRLAVAGGREGWARFAFMVVGVGMGWNFIPFAAGDVFSNPVRHPERSEGSKGGLVSRVRAT